MQQYNLGKRLNKFGNKGQQAVTKELQQMHVMEAFTPMDATKLTYDDRNNSITALMLLTEKRNDDIKGRAVPDGRKQCQYIKKEHASSPTSALESILIVASITAHEGRDATTIDLSGACLHTDSDEDVILHLKGKLAELMATIDPQFYRKYIVNDAKGHPELYVMVQKAIYGVLRSALLFYLKLVNDLEDCGFQLNPYDPCVANMDIGGKQMTMIWHVDDTHASHEDPFEIMKLAVYLSNLYGENLTVKR